MNHMQSLRFENKVSCVQLLCIVLLIQFLPVVTSQLVWVLILSTVKLLPDGVGSGNYAVSISWPDAITVTELA